MLAEGSKLGCAKERRGHAQHPVSLIRALGLRGAQGGEEARTIGSNLATSWDAGLSFSSFSMEGAVRSKGKNFLEPQLDGGGKRRWDLLFTLEEQAQSIKEAAHGLQDREQTAAR